MGTISIRGYNASSTEGISIQWSYTSFFLSDIPIIFAPLALISFALFSVSLYVESLGLIIITYTFESIKASGPCFSSPPGIPSA